MTSKTKILGTVGVLLVVCILGAAMSVSSSAADDLKSFGVEKGSTIRVLDSTSQAGRGGTMFTVIEVKGWHVLASYSGKGKEFSGRNQFVLDLEEASFQVVRTPSAKKK